MAGIFIGSINSHISNRIDLRLESQEILDNLPDFYESIKSYDYGIITASRHEYTEEENEERNGQLSKELSIAGFDVIPFLGSFVENHKSSKPVKVIEKSFLVIDKSRIGNLVNYLYKLGEKYDQDCIVYGEAGDSSVIIGTSHRSDSYPGFGKIKNHKIF